MPSLFNGTDECSPLGRSQVAQGLCSAATAQGREMIHKCVRGIIGLIILTLALVWSTVTAL